MANGIPINSLRDLLLLREMRRQADPVASGLGALSEGIATGIEEQRQLKLIAKKEEEQHQRAIQRSEDLDNSLKGKYHKIYSVGTGGTQIKFETPKKETTFDTEADIPEGYEIVGYYASGRPMLRKSPIDETSNLNIEQELQAEALAKRLSGVRGAARILPKIKKAMAQGMSIDEIEDSLRYASQSPEFSGAVRNAAQTILIKQSPSIAQNAMDYMDDLVSTGDIFGAKEQLKRLARDTSGTEMSRNIMGKERTVEFLNEIEDELKIIENSGINTNIFSGTLEDMFRKVGAVHKPELAEVATKIATAIQNYRRSMSGVAFSVPESREYKDMFPSIKRVSKLNTATLTALKDVMRGDLRNFYSLSMGTKNYQELFEKRSVDVQVEMDPYEQYMKAYERRMGDR